MGFLRILSGFSLINILRALIPFALLPVLTRALTPSDYGILSIFESTILILTPLMLFSAHGFLGSRYYKITKLDAAKLNVNALFLAFSLYIFIQFCFLIFGNVFRHWFGFSNSFFLFIPVFVLFRSLNTYITTVWQIQHNIKIYGFFSVGTLFIDLLLSLLFVVSLGYGYKGRLFGSHLSLLVFSLIGLMLLRNGGMLKGKLSRLRLKEIFRFGAPLIPHTLGGMSLAMVNRYLIAGQLGNDAVGVFAVAYQVASVMLLVGTSINQAWSVSLFRLLGEGAEKNRTTIRRLMAGMFLLLVVACSVLFFLKNFLFGLLAGQAFDVSEQYFPYLLLSFFFQSVYFLFVNFDFYEERVWMIGATTFITALINIALNVVLISRFGVLGSVYAAMGSMGLYLFLVTMRVMIFNKSFRQVWLS